MKKVVIRCFSDFIISKYHIIIFDKFNNKICDKYINNKIELFLNKDVYIIIIIPFDINSFVLRTSFIVSNDISNYNHYIKRKDNSLKITAMLVDKNYNNLPIERGKIKLWQDHIQ